MADRSLFDHRQDPELGARLRDALTAGDDAAFVARVVAQFDARREAGARYLEVLAGWARVGVAAALVVAAAGYLAATRSHAPAAGGALEELLADAPSRLPPAPLVTSHQPPDPNVVFAAVFER